MFGIKTHSHVENRWHSRILYSLIKQKVTLAELQEMVIQVRSSPGTSFQNRRYLEVFKSLQEQGAIGELPELAYRCAVMPELLEGGDWPDPDMALLQLQSRCVLQDMIAEGNAMRTGPGTFMFTENAME